MRHNVGDILKSYILEDICVVLTSENNATYYKVYSIRNKQVVEYLLTQIWNKICCVD